MGVNYLRAIFSIVCALGLTTVTSHAQNAALPATNAPTFTVNLVRENAVGMSPVSRVYVAMGTNKFALLCPAGYRYRPEPAQKKVVVSSEDGRCSLQFQVGRPLVLGTNELKAEMLRPQLLERYADVKILEEFSLSAGGKSGPAFDMNWRTPGGLSLFTRTVFIPSEAGLLEFSLVTDPDKAKEFHYVFNTFLLSFRASRNGKLEVTPLSNKL